MFKSFLKRIRPVLSFELSKNPVIKKDYNLGQGKYIPNPYKAVFIISADFELAWAWRFSKSLQDSFRYSEKMAEKERNNMPGLLQLCDKYQIPVTWATVGHLFLKSCNCDNQFPHATVERLDYFENEWWEYNTGDWFDSDPCSNVKNDPHWYCPDIIKTIINAEVNHEMGCHTFSHIDCTDEICKPEVLRTELTACREAAKTFGINLQSFVFPGHTMGNYQTLHDMGFSNFRSNFINTLGYPVLHDNGLWEHQASMEIAYNSNWPEKYNKYRYKKVLKRAISNNSVCHLWFHPSFTAESMNMFEYILKIADKYRDKLYITTMNEYTHWLNENAR